MICVFFFTSFYLDQTNVANYCKYLLEKLPVTHYNTFIYLISFGRCVKLKIIYWINNIITTFDRELLKHKNINKSTPEKLSFVFSKVMLKQSDNEDSTGTIEILDYNYNGIQQSNNFFYTL